MPERLGFVGHRLEPGLSGSACRTPRARAARAALLIVARFEVTSARSSCAT